MKKKQHIVSTAYFGPVQYYTKFIDSEVLIEACENYSRRSYRNRCEIYGANGRLTMVVPVEKGIAAKTPIRDVVISYKENWQHIHIKSLESAYKSSPFYEYYIDELSELFQEKTRYLFDLNQLAHAKITELLDIDTSCKLTECYQKNYNQADDLRSCITPRESLRKDDACFNPVPYYQVFSEKHGFIPGLSILDLLFNEGPNAAIILESCLVE